MCLHVRFPHHNCVSWGHRGIWDWLQSICDVTNHVQRNFPFSTDGCENSLQVLNIAHSSLAIISEAQTFNCSNNKQNNFLSGGLLLISHQEFFLTVRHFEGQKPAYLLISIR